jgi:plastocyanin
MRRAVAAALALAIAAAGWAMSTDRASAASFTVSAKDFAFTPAELTVHVGDRVTWTNGDAESHAVQGGSLSSPEIVAGGSFTHTFTEPEDISYICRFHTYMSGTIRVLAAEAGGGTATTKPAGPATTKAPATAAPETTTTTVPATSGTHGSAFQQVPDDPSARIPPAGSSRPTGGRSDTLSPAAGGPAVDGGTTSTTAPPRGATFQDVPDDASGTRAPGEVVAQSVGQETPAHIEEGGDPPPAATAPAGDGTVLAPFEEKDGAKEFHLTLDESQVEVTPGVTKPAYAINGSVPGPTIKVDEGDRIRIVVDNQLPFPTSVHWHGMILPNDQDGVGGITQPHIEPGQTYTYEYTAVATGTHWYHAHSSGRHIGKGLYGALIVVPKQGDFTAAKDYIAMLGDTDLGFTINGRSFPSTPVYEAKVGEVVRLRVINTGDQVHAFHLHGVPYQVVAQDGIPKAQPESMDTLTISPGQTYDLLFSERYPGDWVIHCHMFIHSHESADVHADGSSGMNGITAIFRIAKPDPSTPTTAKAAVGAAGVGDDLSPVAVGIAVLLVLALAAVFVRTRPRTLPTPT